MLYCPFRKRLGGELKTCTKCGSAKPESEFFRYSGRPGYRPSCKACMQKARPPDNPETRKRWLSQTAERRSAWQKEYYAKNKDACWNRVKVSRAKKLEQYREANPEIYREYKVRRRLVEVRATPKWANLDAIRAWYTFAAVTPGVHVDHIVPLNSPIVCGLHCEFNLQLLPASENMSKGNRYWPDMPI